MYIFNMDNSLVTALICLRMCMCIAEICMEKSLSQNFELGLSFCFILCKRRDFGEKKIITQFPRL